MTTDPNETPVQGVERFTAMVLEMLHQAHIADGSPLEITDDGWLTGDHVTQYPDGESPKRGALAPGVEHIEGIAWHWTDTRGCGAMNLAKRIATAGGRAASWHALIDATGTAVQSVTTKHGAWHVGSDTAALFTRNASDRSWSMLSPAQRGGMSGYGGNRWLFGIELENVGEVRLVGSEWLGWPFRHDYIAPGDTAPTRPAIVPATEVQPQNATHGHHRFTIPQVETARRITSTLARHYGLTRSACSWGHCEIDPQRRTDPGPLWLGFGADGKTCERGAKPVVRGWLHDILDGIFAPK